VVGILGHGGVALPRGLSHGLLKRRPLHNSFSLEGLVLFLATGGLAWFVFWGVADRIIVLVLWWWCCSERVFDDGAGTRESESGVEPPHSKR
jgi:hypothetical protein